MNNTAILVNQTGAKTKPHAWIVETLKAGSSVRPRRWAIAPGVPSLVTGCSLLFAHARCWCSMAAGLAVLALLLPAPAVQGQTLPEYPTLPANTPIVTIPSGQQGTAANAPINLKFAWKSGTPLNSVAEAEAMLNDPLATTFQTTCSSINFVGLGRTGSTIGPRTENPAVDFPAEVPWSDFAMQATGHLDISEAGHWIFLVNSDDGFKLTVGGVEVMNQPVGRPPDNSVAVCNFPTTGIYHFTLKYFQGPGGSSCRLLVTPPSGFFTGTRATDNTLVEVPALVEVGGALPGGGNGSILGLNGPISGKVVQATEPVTSTDGALTVLGTPSLQQSVDYFSSTWFSVGDDVASPYTFIQPTLRLGPFVDGVPESNYVVEQTGTLVVPKDGTYQSSIFSDGGFHLTVTGGTDTQVTDSDSGLGFTDGSGQVTYPADTFNSAVRFTMKLTEGEHSVKVVWWNNTGPGFFEWNQEILPGAQIIPFGFLKAQAEASATVTPIRTTEEPAGRVGDFNGDGRVDVLDLAVLDNLFGMNVPAGTGADLNGNGVVERGDSSLFLDSWHLSTDPPPSLPSGGLSLIINKPSDGSIPFQFTIANKTEASIKLAEWNVSIWGSDLCTDSVALLSANNPDWTTVSQDVNGDGACDTFGEVALDPAAAYYVGAGEFLNIAWGSDNRWSNAHTLSMADFEWGFFQAVTEENWSSDPVLNVFPTGPIIVPGTSITLDASGSTDRDGDSLSFEFLDGVISLGTKSTSPTRTVTPSTGTHAYTVIVSDGKVSSEATSYVNVQTLGDATKDVVNIVVNEFPERYQPPVTIKLHTAATLFDEGQNNAAVNVLKATTHQVNGWVTAGKITITSGKKVTDATRYIIEADQ